MRVVIQRVINASVTVNNKKRHIGKGLVILLGIGKDDTENDARWLVNKILDLRIFSNNDGKFDYSIMDIKGDILVVSQFTLYGDCCKGKRPDFSGAADQGKAKELYDACVNHLERSGLNVTTGEFAANMLVEIFNDGPVTIFLESNKSKHE